MASRLHTRLTKLETACLASALPASEGLASLLDWHRRHPPAEALDLTPPLTGLARLLAEARQRAKIAAGRW